MKGRTKERRPLQRVVDVFLFRDMQAALLDVRVPFPVFELCAIVYLLSRSFEFASLSLSTTTTTSKNRPNYFVMPRREQSIVNDVKKGDSRDNNKGRASREEVQLQANNDGAIAANYCLVCILKDELKLQVVQLYMQQGTIRLDSTRL